MKISKAAEVWLAKALASKENLGKSPLRVKEESRKAKEAYIAWRKNCITLLERPAINDEPPVDTDCKRSMQIDSSNNPKNKKIPVPEHLKRMFELLGATFESLPRTYMDLHEAMPTEGAKTFIKSRCEKKKIDLHSSFSPHKAYKLISVLQKTFPELHHNMVAVYEGVLEVEFSQEGFSGADDLSKKGLCYPLVLKWLADQGSGQFMVFLIILIPAKVVKS